MCPRNGKAVIPWAAGVMLLALATLTGCVRVEVVDTAPVADTSDLHAKPATQESKDHNLAILAVDFDPPLNYHQLIIQRQSGALLVTIENSGTSTEHNVTVRAQLSAPQDPKLLLTQGASIASIAPGEVQVVCFSHLGELPFYQAYYLEVMVDAVQGEKDLSDNQKAFDIQIYQEESP